MNIKILFDKNVPSCEYASGWGFSALIGGKVLFDTGCDGKRLLKNMKKMKIDTREIKTVVVSHNHWDHWGGLKAFLKMRPGVRIWVGWEGFKESRFLAKLPGKNNICHSGKFFPVSAGIYSTGEIAGKYLRKKMPEQSVVVRTRKGLTVLTGCAHPGIVKILDEVREAFKEKIYLVAGGFHLYGKRRATINGIIRRFRKMGIKVAAPCHCSGKTAVKMFKEAYGERFMKLEVGSSLEV
ncbi:MAG TPA: MBL fold metallo-hydrolase [Candidatus Omnitrophota bacterium]|nr:MBL fold metallo-hydrolase [Candidatus Omnitrophota bacterium]